MYQIWNSLYRVRWPDRVSTASATDLSHKHSSRMKASMQCSSCCYSQYHTNTMTHTTLY